jgi:hypothetical protein
MKARSILLLSALLAATTVSAAETGRAAPREQALMLYFSKSLGGNQRHATAPLAFGLRLQQSSPFGSSHAVALVDARYWLGGSRVLAFAGVPAFSGSEDEDEGSSGSSGGSSGGLGRFIGEHPGWSAVMIAAALFGGACILELGICEDDDAPSDPTYPTGTH